MQTPERPFLVRAAGPADRPTLVAFNIYLAEESEGLRLDPQVVDRGVERALTVPDRLRYWVAVPSPEAAPIGQAAISREWSDWRDGWIWWLQSVYVAPDHRKRGIFRALYHQIRTEALAERDVIGLRLYVEESNRKAQETYSALGMRPGGYHVYEELWPDRFSSPRG